MNMARRRPSVGGNVPGRRERGNRLRPCSYRLTSGEGIFYPEPSWRNGPHRPGLSDPPIP